ncbi:MAG: trypsin-like peptidase domain-containing protein [Bryobacterales bacterium]|nr:trypsin-like peptidase domain-containing protein [Bryobacterales bacterium]
MGEGFGEVVEGLRRSTVQVNRGGSGVVWSTNGRIVTNAHVVEGLPASSAIQVNLWDGRRVPGEIVQRDRRRDLAVLQVEASGLTAAKGGDSNALRVGELVIAVGNPMGFIGAASTGVVHRIETRSFIETRSWVVSQLRLAPGNSGGPLANARGEVVGINTMIAGGLAFAIPSRSVERFLMAPRQAQDGLGVVVRPVVVERPPRQLALIVLEVIPHSPADRASLLQGDILMGAGGEPFQSVQDLEIAIDGSRGGILELQFRRGANDNIRTVAARMAPRSARAA